MWLQQPDAFTLVQLHLEYISTWSFHYLITIRSNKTHDETKFTVNSLYYTIVVFSVWWTFDLLTHIAKICFTKRNWKPHIEWKMFIFIIDHILYGQNLSAFCQRLVNPTVSKSPSSTDRSGNRISENLHDQHDRQVRRRVWLVNRSRPLLWLCFSLYDLWFLTTPISVLSVWRSIYI